jgi:hypothetical protein
MPDSFQLTVPADSRFRSLVPDLASRYVEIIGGSAADATALASQLTDALHELIREVGETETIKFDFRPGDAAVEVVLAHDGQVRTLRCPIAAK